MSKELTKIVWNQLSLVPEAYKLIDSLSINSSIYLFGGLVRDYLDGRIDKIRDIDIVVQSYCGKKKVLSDYISTLDPKFIKKIDMVVINLLSLEILLSIFGILSLHGHLEMVIFLRLYLIFFPLFI